MDGRDVVVTGGGGFLGGAVVKRLVEMGARVHVPAFDDRDEERVAKLELGDRVIVTTRVDLDDEESVEGFYDTVGDLWASVHLAGGFVWGPIADASLDDLERMYARNVRTCWLCCRAAQARMGDAGGRIVNVTAKPALVPVGNLAAYAASKGAVAALTTSLAEELAPRGIWVNAVAPSIMDTPPNRESMPEADFDLWPKTHEVAATIAHLASPENHVTRGAIVPVYGRS